MIQGLVKLTQLIPGCPKCPESIDNTILSIPHFIVQPTGLYYNLSKSQLRYL